MFHRIHSGRKDSGKWKRRPHTGVGNVATEEYRGWTIELTHRKLGTTVKRDQFVVTLRGDSPASHEQLPGFATKAAALVAARKRIDLLSAVRRPLGLTRSTHRVRRSWNDV